MKKNYKSLGEMLKVGDFESLIKDLIKMQTSEEFKKFTKTNEENPISELDDLLFFLPQYAFKTEKNSEGEKVITKEIIPGALNFLDFALKNGANPNAYMKNGENAYLKSCEAPSPEILDYLINNKYTKIDLNHTDGMGNNGLFYATMSNSTEIIEYLVKKCNFNINEKNFFTNEQTVMHYACGHLKEKSFDKLIELGANPTLKDNNGYKPVEMILLGYSKEDIEEYDAKDKEDFEELKKWKTFYDKVLTITQSYETNNQKKLKVKF